MQDKQHPSYNVVPSNYTPSLLNGKPWFWNNKRAEAAVLLAEDKLTDNEIAAKLDISRQSLARWKKIPEFEERQREHVEAKAMHVRKKWFAKPELRAEVLARDIKATDIILEERGKQLQDELHAAEVVLAPDNAAPEQPQASTDKKPPMSETTDPYAGGARTGFIARDYKMAGNGTTRPIYAFDAALMRERRANLEAISKHLGQWDAENESQVGVAVTVNLTPQDAKL
jgi:hypothetical protein